MTPLKQPLFALQRSLKWVALVACVLAGALLLPRLIDTGGPAPEPMRLALVVPDALLPEHQANVAAWQDAAVEVGFELTVVRASQLLQAGALAEDAALILPDSIHQRMNAMLIAEVRNRVSRGARLMLTFDAGLLNMDGSTSPGGSRFSALAGVAYGAQQPRGVSATRQAEVLLSPAVLETLELPPGRAVLAGDGTVHSPTRTAAAPGTPMLTLATYVYGRPQYPVFSTTGRFDGERLMHSAQGDLIAGRSRYGRGQVLFVNLPLGLLKLRTDGSLLHGFLRHFAQDMAQLPRLAPMPRDQGAVILNWHIDAADGMVAADTLQSMGVFQHGPFSIHLTAGPDLNAEGDAGGINLVANERARQWVKQAAEQGHELGSHGGWIHNQFGAMVDKWPQERSSGLIELNNAAVSSASGKAVREYSAPVGHHPAWTTRWLAQRDIDAFYFTGDSGMPPTRSYQDSARGPERAWAFPVMSFGIQASFEEARAQGIAEDEVTQWLIDATAFCLRHRTVRLIYAHPPGALAYRQAFMRWLEYTSAAGREGHSPWMTMAQYAEFANRRLDVRWELSVAKELSQGRSGYLLHARHPSQLAQFSWLLPSTRFAKPELREGEAEIVQDGDQWRVTATGGSRLTLELPAVPRRAVGP